jgi:hypothetical protein
MTDPLKETLLRLQLATQVPLLIGQLLGGHLAWPDQAEREAMSRKIGAEGDTILYSVPGKTAEVVTTLAMALAILAFEPGGVDFLRTHFEVPADQAAAFFARQAQRERQYKDETERSRSAQRWRRSVHILRLDKRKPTNIIIPRGRLNFSRPLFSFQEVDE